jgi:pimeloyl-ACP methyl ester carboxylesterase
MSSLPAAVQADDIATSRLRTHVLRSGPGGAPALVLVHGNVSSARFFAETMAELGGSWHCIAADLRGFGRSERAPIDARRGLRDFADDLHALLAETGLVRRGQRVHLLGWSLGAGVAMQYAMDHPGAVASIVLESPMSPFGFGGTRDTTGAPCWPDFAGDFYPGDQVASPNWPGTAPGPRGVNNAISPKYCDLSGFAGIGDQPDVLWIRGDADQIVSDASLVDLGNLGALGIVPGWPGRHIYPAQPMVGQMRAVLDRYRAAGGRYTERVLAPCGHSPHLERPREFAEIVTQFLAG